MRGLDLGDSPTIQPPPTPATPASAAPTSDAARVKTPNTTKMLIQLPALMTDAGNKLCQALQEHGVTKIEAEQLTRNLREANQSGTTYAHRYQAVIDSTDDIETRKNHFARIKTYYGEITALSTALSAQPPPALDFLHSEVQKWDKHISGLAGIIPEMVITPVTVTKPQMNENTGLVSSIRKNCSCHIL